MFVPLIAQRLARNQVKILIPCSSFGILHSFSSTQGFNRSKLLFPGENVTLDTPGTWEQKCRAGEGI